MKAAIYSQYGPPEVVSIAEVPKPVPAANEVLIHVHATTVNRTDCGFRSAEYFIVRFFSGLLRPKNPILGCEFAGEIVGLGKEVVSYRLGDRVFGYNDVRFGSHAEYTVMPQDGPMAIIPTQLSYAEAAAMTEGVHYALCDLRAAKVGKGTRILINGATGAIGSAAVQLSKYLGAHTTAVCHTEQVNTVAALGADVVIDRMAQDFTELNEQFDVVFDAVGKSSFGQCKPLLTAKGIYMSTELGPNWENPFLAIITPLLGGKRVLFPLPSISKEDVQLFADPCRTGQLQTFDRQALCLGGHC
jgi:NADPH:quinone reductase-like Zn-dependent oxidoreductase